ncbi:rna-directed dna polymerase from mobile element jockey-like [Pitangus sulphuratus]|nr:rna-directed dna polymerase from mobile element jockey-like [Pitangus sulphuratus]
MGNWVDCHMQRALVSSSVSTGVPQESVMGPVPVNNFNNDIKCTLSEFAGDTKLSGDTPGGGDAAQRDLGKLQIWDHGNLVAFNAAKCKVLHHPAIP